MWVYLRVEEQPPWIYHNATLWLISLSSDGSTWITISDKNLWATAVYNSWATLSEANCGKFYQWGNNYGFPFTWAVTTSSTQVNVGTYWPWNYYSSSTFICSASLTNYDRANPQNDNLRWWVTWTVEAMQWPCNTWFHIPSENELTLLLSDMVSLGMTVDNWKTYLKMPFAWGLNWQTWAKYDSSSWLSLYSSTSVNDIYMMCLCFTTNWAAVNIRQSLRAIGCNIRPFKNDAVKPDDTRTVLYQPS